VKNQFFSKYVIIFISYNYVLTWLLSEDLLFNDYDNSLIAFVSGSMPDDIRANLVKSINTALALEASSHHLQSQDSRETGSDGVGPKFPAYHFVYYSRSGAKVRFSFF
jgi:hypothetical protein